MNYPYSFEKQVTADLATLKERTKDLPELAKRVDSLESDRDKIKGLAYVGTGTGIVGFFVTIWRYITH